MTELGRALVHADTGMYVIAADPVEDPDGTWAKALLGGLDEGLVEHVNRAHGGQPRTTAAPTARTWQHPPLLDRRPRPPAPAGSPRP